MRGLGYLPDPLDERDRRMGVVRASDEPRASEVRFDDLVAGIRDQGNTNSCVGQSTACAIELRRALDGQPRVAISALGLYWPARALNNYQHEDGGAFIRSAMRVAHRLGVPAESAWPFREDRVNERPSIEAEVGGLTRADGVYERIVGTGVDRAEAVLDALQARCPVVFGTLVPDYFSRPGADTIPAPPPGSFFRGGHAMALCGFDRSGERVRVANSWGRGWADGGFGWLAIEWMSVDSTSDVWALRPRTTGGAHA